MLFFHLLEDELDVEWVQDAQKIILNKSQFAGYYYGKIDNSISGLNDTLTNAVMKRNISTFLQDFFSEDRDKQQWYIVAIGSLTLFNTIYTWRNCLLCSFLADLNAKLHDIYYWMRFTPSKFHARPINSRQTGCQLAWQPYLKHRRDIKGQELPS